MFAWVGKPAAQLNFGLKTPYIKANSKAKIKTSKRILAGADNGYFSNVFCAL